VAQAWREVERAAGYECPPLLKRLVNTEDFFAPRTDVEREEEDLRGVLDDFMRDRLPLVFYWSAEFASTFVEEAEGEASPPSERTDEKRPGRRRVYQKPFERRVRILGFVAERVLHPLDLLTGRFGTTGRRIAWRELAPIWNKAFPYDAMTTEELRVAYWRAKRDNEVRRIYVRRKLQEVSAILMPTHPFMRAMLTSPMARQIRVVPFGVSLEELRRVVGSGGTRPPARPGRARSKRSPT